MYQWLGCWWLDDDDDDIVIFKVSFDKTIEPEYIDTKSPIFLN